MASKLRVRRASTLTTVTPDRADRIVTTTTAGVRAVTYGDLEDTATAAADAIAVSSGSAAGAAAGANAGAAAASPFVAAAEAEATSAATQRAAADLAADSAADRAGAAQASATVASLAATQALTASPIYPDTAAGLAAVADGATFSVAGAGDSFAILYRRDGAAAVELGRYPSKALVDSIPGRDTAGLGGLLAALRAIQTDGSLAAFATWADQGRLFQTAGHRWRYIAGRGAVWENDTETARASLTATGLEVEGRVEFRDTDGAISEAAGGADILAAHRVDGYLVHYVGQRQHYAAGMLNVLATDGSRSITDLHGSLVTVSASGAATWRGALPGEDSGSSGGPLFALRGAGGYIAAFETDAEGVLRLQGTSSTAAAFGPGDAAFYGITGEGDESALVIQAHDGAASAGLRYLDFGAMQVTAPDAIYLGDVIFTGQRQLIGAYRKRVTPYSAPSLHMVSDIVPQRHLTALAATASPVVVIMGDSTAVGSDSMHAPSIGLWGALRRKLVRDNPHKAFVWHNVAVGGATWATALADAALLDAVEALAPDVLFFNYGMNDTDPLPAMASVLARVRTFAKVPDLVVITNMLPTSQGASYGSREAQEAREANAGIQRTTAKAQRVGLIDVHRNFCAVRDGFDLLMQGAVQEAFNLSTTFPYTTTRECTEYAFRILTPSSAFATFVTSPASLAIPLSGRDGNAILIRRVSSIFEVQVQTSADRILVPWFATGIGTTSNISGSVRADGYCTLALNDVTVWEGYAERYGGLFTPRIGLAGAETTMDVTVNQIAVGVPRLVAPSATDRDLWGAAGAGAVDNGNDINHLSADGVAAVYYPAVEAANFAT